MERLLLRRDVRIRHYNQNARRATRHEQIGRKHGMEINIKKSKA